MQTIVYSPDDMTYVLQASFDETEIDTALINTLARIVVLVHDCRQSSARLGVLSSSMLDEYEHLAQVLIDKFGTSLGPADMLQSSKISSAEILEKILRCMRDVSTPAVKEQLVSMYMLVLRYHQRPTGSSGAVGSEGGLASSATSTTKYVPSLCLLAD